MYGGFHDTIPEGRVFRESHQAGRVVIVRIGRSGYGARDGEVLDGGAVRAVEGGCALPGTHDMDGERMAGAVERTGVLMIVSTHHHRVITEADLGFETGVEFSHTLFVDEFAEHLPLVGVLDEYRAVLVTARHNEGVREGCRLVEVVLFLLESDGGLARRAAEQEFAVIIAEH